jgi:segregation and condensation protein A
MKTYDVHLDIFEGPLDLLLYLIRKSDLDIYDIPISQITSEYLAYMDVMKDLSLDVAGEFLVMASTLMQIKAQTLLPAPSVEGDDGPDPRAELVNRLLEYQRYKEAAKELHHKLEANKDVFYRGAPVFSENDYHMDASLFDLLDAFRDVLKELKPEVREVLYEEIPIEFKTREILDFMEGRPYATFRELLRLATNRHGLIVTFLALLELIRLKQIVARQVQIFGEIRVYKIEEGRDIPDVVEEMTAARQLDEPAAPPAGESGGGEAQQPGTRASGPDNG